MNLHHDIDTTTPQHTHIYTLATLESEGTKFSENIFYRDKLTKKDLKQPPSDSNIRQRIKSISLTKSQKCYENYLDKVPLYSRKFDDPITPRVDANLSNSQWRNVLSEWRKKIHSYSTSIDSTNINSCGFSPVLFRPSWFSGNLTNPGFIVLAETEFGRKIFGLEELLASDSDAETLNSKDTEQTDIESLERLMLFDLSNLNIDNIND